MQYTITSYSELEKWSKAFAGGHFGLFFLIGHQGQAKSRMMEDYIVNQQQKDEEKRKKAAKSKKSQRFRIPLPPHANYISEPLWISGGNVTAFQFYQELYNHLNQTIVIDDVDSIYNDRVFIRLLKALCQTEKEKRVGWHSASKELLGKEIPMTFKTHSRVCIIANEWQILSRHVASLVDRGVMVHFNPTPQEVMKKAKTWFKDKEIISFVSKYLPLVETFSMRTLVNAATAKEAGKKFKLPWQKAVLEEMGVRRLVLVKELLANKKFRSDVEREKEFMRETGLSRPLYYKAKQEFHEKTKEGIVF